MARKPGTGKSQGDSSDGSPAAAASSAKSPRDKDRRSPGRRVRSTRGKSGPSHRAGDATRGGSGGDGRHHALLAEIHLPVVKRFCATLKASEQSFFFADQVLRRLQDFLESEPNLDADTLRAVRRMFRGCSEVLLWDTAAYAVLRPGVGKKLVVRIQPDSDHVELVSRGEYLQIKDAYVQGPEEAAKSGLVIDFSPFFRNFPRVTDAREMGAGISFLNRHLSALTYQNPSVFRHALLSFLRRRTLNGVSILVNEHLASPDDLVEELAAVRSWLDEGDPDEPYSELAHELRVHGFEPGWGKTAGDIAENLHLLSQVIESSEPARFERLLGRLPLIRTVLMVSPHGWFAQDGVLGKPDTGGQVTYVLDQARALEHEMRQQFLDSGLDVKPKVVILTRLIPEAEGTACGVQREKISGTEDSWIIRCPFRDVHGEVIPQWISRFHIWPYLERFAAEAKQLVVTELLGKPDLIVGHYTDGNLVAYRLADELDATHCACVHALEKTKYLMSDMHWADMEHDYHFSLQFTADLVAYNAADFILSSSYREVGGTATEMGMLESYEMFSLPGLYRVQNGLDPRLARHNIVPPGANEEYFFPHTESERRVTAVGEHLAQRFLQSEPGPGCIGRLERPELPLVFAMARMDRIKNLSGLVSMFGENQALREKANLLLITSVNDPAQSKDLEEIEEVNKTYELIQQHQLDGQFRWGAARLDKVETGEMYRLVADRQGVFAQPAFMETFGLTVVESMACGLPVVVTCFGGPAEIVIPGSSGMIENPNDHSAFAAALESIVSHPDLWHRYSQGGIQRVNEAFTWGRHALRVLRLANVYAYWNHVDVVNRPALDRYLHTLYHTVYRQRTFSI